MPIPDISSNVYSWKNPHPFKILNLIQISSLNDANIRRAVGFMKINFLFGFLRKFSCTVMDDFSVAITLLCLMASLRRWILNYPVLHDCNDLSLQGDDVWYVIRHMVGRSFLYINLAKKMRAIALNSWRRRGAMVRIY